MFTSLVGARSSSTLPTGGRRPLQLQNRMRMKNEAKMGTWRAAAGPPVLRAKPSSDSKAHSTKFWRRPGTRRGRRVAANPTNSSTTSMIHIVRMVEVMLGWKVMTRDPVGIGFSGSRSQMTCGGGNSRLPLMKQTGKAHASPASPPFGNGGRSRKARTSMTTTARRSRTMGWMRRRAPRPAAATGASVTISGSFATVAPVARRAALPPRGRQSSASARNRKISRNTTRAPRAIPTKNPTSRKMGSVPSC